MAKVKMKSGKTSLSLIISSLLLGSVLAEEIDGTTVEVSSSNSQYFVRLTNEAQLINKITYGGNIHLNSLNYSKFINDATGVLNTNDWTAVNAKDVVFSEITNKGTINLIEDDSPNNGRLSIMGLHADKLLASEFVNEGSILADNVEANEVELNGMEVRQATSSNIINKNIIDLKATGKEGYIYGIELSGFGVSESEKEVTSTKISNEKDIIISSKGNISNIGIAIHEVQFSTGSALENSGNIEVKSRGEEAEVEGISAENISGATVTNSGSIVVNATGTNTTSGSSEAVGIWIDELTNSSTITNTQTGVIKANANGATTQNFFLSTAIGIGEIDSSYIENSGKIIATVNDKLDARGLALDITNGDVDSEITNDGYIFGNIYLAKNRVSLENSNMTDNSNFEGSFTNEGLIVLPYNANKSASMIYKELEDSDPLYNQRVKVSLQPNFAEFTNSGTIIVGAKKSSNGTIENTQIKAKNATFEAGSQLGVYIAPNSLAFSSGDRLSEVFKVDETLNGVENITTIKGDLSNISEDRIKSELEAIKSTYKLSALLDVNVEKVGENQIDLIVTTNSVAGTIIENTNSGNVSKITLEVAEIFDTIRANPSKYPALSTVLAQVDNVQYAKDVVSALNSFTPTTAMAVSNISNSITNSVSNVVSSRLASLQNSSGLNSGDDMVVDNNRLWTKVYGSLGKQNDKDNIAGFDLKSYGLGLGYDKKYKDSQIFGMAAFYTNAKVDTNGINHKNDVDAYSLVAYGSNLLRDDKTTVYYQASHTWQKNDSKRGVFTGDTANAKFTSKTLALDIKFGHKIAVNDRFNIEPIVGTSYKKVSNPSFTESGAGALNMQTDKFSSTEILANFGTNFEYQINNSSTLTANIGAGYDLKGDDTSITSSFAGTDLSFDSKGIDNGRWKYQAGVGYDISLNQNNNLNFSYNYQGEGSKFNNNIVSLDYIYKF